MKEQLDPWSYLQSLSDKDDEAIDLAKAALALGAMELEGVSLERYIHHLNVLVKDCESRYQTYMVEGRDDCAGLRHEILVDILADEYGYVGDNQSYDDLQNANLCKVIDRAKGLPIALSILYIHVGRVLDWNVGGVNFPGHFMCRIEMAGERIIFDPFQSGRIMEAPDLRILIKKVLGDQAELSSDYYNLASNREILTRLENNIKHRKIEVEDYAGALVHVERMRVISPDDYRLLLDAGVLYAKTEQARAAMECLTQYVKRAPQGRARHEAEMLLRELVQRLN